MHFHVLVCAKPFHDTLDFTSGIMTGFWEAEFDLNIKKFFNTYWGILRK